MGTSLPQQRKSWNAKQWDNSDIINCRKLEESEARTILWELRPQRGGQSYEAESIVEMKLCCNWRCHSKEKEGEKYPVFSPHLTFQSCISVPPCLNLCRNQRSRECGKYSLKCRAKQKVEKKGSESKLTIDGWSLVVKWSEFKVDLKKRLPWDTSRNEIPTHYAVEERLSQRHKEAQRWQLTVECWDWQVD